MLQSCFYVPPSLRPKAAAARTPPSGQYILQIVVQFLNITGMGTHKKNFLQLEPGEHWNRLLVGGTQAVYQTQRSRIVILLPSHKQMSVYILSTQVSTLVAVCLFLVICFPFPDTVDTHNWSWGLLCYRHFTYLIRLILSLHTEVARFIFMFLWVVSDLHSPF